jgi:methyl-accepting chemotaxis protein
MKDIAERMAILSLNGSIQAARLGEKGGPFKVVAHEMQSLAGEIGELINQVEENTVRDIRKRKASF